METARPEYRVIGTRPIRHDGVNKVMGRAKYGADYSFPGMLHGKVLRSPHAHARIVSIDYTKALALPGVKAVVTAEDLPELADGSASAGELRVNPRLLSRNVLAREKVLYHGHAIAAVRPPLRISPRRRCLSSKSSMSVAAGSKRRAGDDARSRDSDTDAAQPGKSGPADQRRRPRAVEARRRG